MIMSFQLSSGSMVIYISSKFRMTSSILVDIKLKSASTRQNPGKYSYTRWSTIFYTGNEIILLVQ